LERGEIQRPPFVIVANFVIFIYSTVVITLLGTHAAPPSELDCGLRRQWQSLFRAKDSSSIRAIQDQYTCCGLTNSHDMAWPFPGKGVDPNACSNLSGSIKGCLGPWKAEEQHIAGLLMGVVGMVVIWAVRFHKHYLGHLTDVLAVPDHCDPYSPRVLAPQDRTGTDLGLHCQRRAWQHWRTAPHQLPAGYKPLLRPRTRGRRR
jgi:hypothetical protein